MGASSASYWTLEHREVRPACGARPNRRYAYGALTIVGLLGNAGRGGEGGGGGGGGG